MTKLARSIDCLRQGDSLQAVKALRQVLEADPQSVAAHNLIGFALSTLNRHTEAIESYRRAIRVRPDHADGHYNLGVTLAALDRHEEAVDCYRTAVSLRPAHADGHSNLGLSLLKLERHEEAAAGYRRAIELRPDHADSHHNLGAALSELGRHEEAVGHFRRAIKICPDAADSHFNLGVALHAMGRFPEAIGCWRRVLTIDPQYPETLDRLALTSLAICDWSRIAEIGSGLTECVRQGRAIVDPFTFLAFSDDPAEQLSCARLFADRQQQPCTRVAQKARRSEDRIRIAYLSADFHEHATMHLMAELLERHDRNRFEVTGVSLGEDDGSAMRQRLEQAFDHFVVANRADDRAVAKLIADRGIHIVVDLKGYTRHSRPGILVRRPAPVQVSYLGYPATMGADFIDYILVDRFVVPPGEQCHFTERLVHLPGCYQVNRRGVAAAGETPSRVAAGLPDAGLVFCCFNNSFKITPDVFDIWMRLLRSVHGSVLWLLGDNDLAARNLRREARSRGVAPDRLVFAPRIPMDRHLARQRLADLFLDTFPVNAHTTASDALRVGLPVLTCSGNSFVSRVAGSLLHTIGLPELATHDLADYEALALDLALDPERLAGLRHRLIQGRATSRLFDTERFRCDLEAAYVCMFETWRADGPTPKPLALSVR